MNLVLIGFKSCGKSTIGKMTAQQLGLPFVDVDVVLEQLYEEKEKQKLSFREIYKRHGKEYYRSLEADAFNVTINMPTSVIAAGGGTFIHTPISHAFQQQSWIVYLYVEPELLFERIKLGGTPAFLDPSNEKPSFYFSFNEREAKYRSIADLTVDNSGTDTASVVNQIVRHFKSVTLIQDKPK
jgi:shikimate kinase